MRRITNGKVRCSVCGKDIHRNDAVLCAIREHTLFGITVSEDVYWCPKCRDDWLKNEQNKENKRRRR